MPVPPPGARERDDSFAIRSPHGRRGLILIRGDRHAAGPPKAHESGGSVAARRPQGRRGLILIRVGRHAAGPPRSQREWRQFRISQPPGTSRSHSDVRVTSLRWTSQKPTNVTSASQFATPRDGEASFCFACGTTPPAGPPRSRRNWRQFRSGRPQGRRRLILICV